jgi:hypothetical protein
MSDIPNVIRFVDFALFGVGCAFMLLTNVLAFRVLRPPKRLGFLWWHVTCISTAFVLLGAVVIDRAFDKLDSVATWQTVATFVGFLAFAIAQILIFGIEKQRYVATRAVAEHHGDTALLKQLDL